MSSKALTRIAALAAAVLLAPATQAGAALPQVSGNPVDLGASPNPFLYGARVNEQAGTSIAPGGDVNGDGRQDLLIGSPLADNNSRTDSGSVYVVLGRESIGERVDLGSLTGSAAFRIDGMLPGDRLGSAVASAGDVNGDGFDDIVVGSPLADPSFRSTAGVVHVIFGSASPRNVDTLNLGTAGFRFDGVTSGDRLGTSVAGGGDVDGDGKDDIVAVASSADPTSARRNAGSAYVFRARAGGSAEVATTAPDLRLDAPLQDDGLSKAVIVPDATGDGRADVLVGAWLADPNGRSGAGSAWLVTGRAESAPVNLGTSSDKRIDGAVAGDAFGAGAATLPDVTGDGKPELVLGATGADPGGRSNAGSFSFLDAGTLGAVNDMAGVTPLARIDGTAAHDAVGQVIAGGGDLDHDGVDEIAIGSPRYDVPRTDGGGVFMIEGNVSGTLTLGSSAARLVVRNSFAGDAAGTSIAWPSDVNADANDDVAVGTPYSDMRSDAGAVYLLLGWGGMPAFSYPSQPAETAALTALAPVRPTVTARTGTATYAISPAPPAGVHFDPATGTLSGTPTEMTEGALAFTVTMTDYASTATAPVTLRISPAPGNCTNLRRVTGAGDDIATGSTGGDEIRGAAGNDRIDGVDGADCLFGDAGGDTLFGGFGDDYLEGGAAADALDGGDGADLLTGGDDTDTLDGGSGDDKMDGGTAADTLRGGDGNDTMGGAVGADTLEGGGGDDTLSGADDPDGLAGGDGNDVLDGGAARDSLRGDGGNDRLDGGAEADTLDGGDGADEIRGGDQVDEIVAGPGDDSAWGDGDEDHMTGGEGNDTLFGGDGFDRIAGGTGADTLRGEDHGDTLEGGEGNDTLDGGLQHDFLIAGGGDDIAFGGAGDDLITGAAGNDTLEGGGEDDFIDAGAGDDQLRGGVRADELRAGAGNDSAWGEDGEDLVDGEGGNDRLWGGAGFDRLTGDAGNDVVLGEAGGDIIEGGDGADAVDGGDGNDTLLGGTGADVVTGGAGNDRVIEKGGADRIDAGAGNDTIDAADGERDVVVCGAGRDTVKADKVDRLSGCEKKTIAGDAASKKKKRKKQKSRRTRR